VTLSCRDASLNGTPLALVLRDHRGMIRQSAATQTLVAAFLVVVGIALWVLALSGVVSPHPWVFMLLGLAATVLEMVAIALAAIAWSRSPRSRVLTIFLVLCAALPPIFVLGLAIAVRV
jgi:NADH:ubiquinone oxidoreductase subunit K